MLDDLERNELGDGDRAARALGLRRPPDQVAGLGDLLLDADPVPHEVDAVHPEGDQLGPPEHRVRGDEDERAIAVVDRLGQTVNLLGR
jgi:hypothetical protein